METLIGLRLLCENLEPLEQQQFVQQLTEKCGINFLMTTIFNYFTKFILEKKSYDNTNITIINAILSDIIQQRPTHAQKPTADSPTPADHKPTLNKLPSVLIAETASFLKQA
eukprot:482162_1